MSALFMMRSQRNAEFEIREYSLVVHLPLRICVSSGEIINLSESQFIHL